eukprot:356031-Chlamydomonas_euryale.AAC.6
MSGRGSAWLQQLCICPKASQATGAVFTTTTDAGASVVERFDTVGFRVCVHRSAHATNTPRPPVANVRRSENVLHACACVAALAALAEPLAQRAATAQTEPPHSRGTAPQPRLFDAAHDP